MINAICYTLIIYLKNEIYIFKNIERFKQLKKKKYLIFNFKKKYIK